MSFGVDFDFVSKQLADARTPAGAQLAGQKRAFISSFRPPANPDGSADTLADTAETAQIYQLEQAVDQKIDHMRADGKDPTDLFEPSKPDFILKSEAMWRTHLSNITGVARTGATSYASNDADDDDLSEHISSAIPVSDVTRFPGFGPPIPPVMNPGTPEWTDNTIRSIQKFIDTYFSRQHGSNDRSRKRPSKRYRSDDDQDFCYKRYEEETQECYDDDWIHAHPHYLSGCLERAQDRRTSCIQNGGRPHPREPLKWNPDDDEESWINHDR